MNRKRYNPPPDGGSTYKKHIREIAAILTNGIAAIFYSTDYCVFVFAFTNTFNVLFALLADKPGHDRPRCRSPPVLHFRFIKVTKMEAR